MQCGPDSVHTDTEHGHEHSERKRVELTRVEADDADPRADDCRNDLRSERRGHGAANGFRSGRTSQQIQVGDTYFLDPRTFERTCIRPQRAGDTDCKERHRHTADEELGEAMRTVRHGHNEGDDENCRAGDADPYPARAWPSRWIIALHFSAPSDAPRRFARPS